MDSSDVPLPPVVYVPCGQDAAADGEQVSIEFRELADGRVALPVYSAVDRLVGCCGDGQSWIVVSSDKLEAIGEQAPYDVIVLDARLPERPAQQGR